MGKKSLINKIRKAQGKRKTGGVSIKHIGVVDKDTAIDFLNLNLKGSHAIETQLIRRLADLRGDLEDAEIVIQHWEKTVNSREKDIEKLHKEIDALEKEMHRRLSAAERDKQLAIRGVVDEATMQFSLFLQSISGTIKSLGKNPNKDPLKNAISKINDLVQQAISAINEDESEKETTTTSSESNNADKKL